MNKLIHSLTSITTGCCLALSTSAYAANNGTDADASGVNKRPLTRVEIAARLGSVPGLVDRIGASGVAHVLDVVAQAHSCAVEDAAGNPVTVISASNVGDQAYWFQYNSGGLSSSQVLFVAVPLFTGSPMELIYQRFNPGNSPTTNIVTPFGVPFWGGDLTSGQWVNVQITDADPSPVACLFEVVP